MPPSIGSNLERGNKQRFKEWRFVFSHDFVLKDTLILETGFIFWRL